MDVAADVAPDWHATANALGGYFTMPQAAPDWQNGHDLLEPAALRTFVADTRAAMARSAGCGTEQVPVRVAASAFQMGVAARIMSPLIGAAITVQALPRLDADALAWRADGHTPVLGHRDPEWMPAADPAAAAATIAEAVLPTIFAPLHEGLRATAALSPQIAGGNVISAANGAVTVLALRHRDLEPAGRDLIRALAATGALRNTGEFAGTTFRRRNCCLFYRVPGAGLCGDCVLARRPGS